MNNEFEGKSFEELQKLLDEALAAYPVVLEQNKEEEKNLTDFIQNEDKELSKAIHALDSGRLGFDDYRVYIKYHESKYSWKSGENEFEEKESIFSSSFSHVSDAFDFFFENKEFNKYESQKALDSAIASSIGSYISNCRHGKGSASLYEIDELTRDARSAIMKLDESFASSLLDIKRKYEESHRRKAEIRRAWYEAASRPEKIFTGMVNIWKKEHTVFSLKKGDKVLLNNYGYVWEVQEVSSSFVYLDSGKKVKHSSIDFDRMRYNEEWYEKYRNLVNEASNKAYHLDRRV